MKYDTILLLTSGGILLATTLGNSLRRITNLEYKVIELQIQLRSKNDN